MPRCVRALEPFPVFILLPLRRFLFALLGLLTLAGCEQPPAVALDQQVYIWQRQWRPAHAQALAESRADFSTLRILAAQLHPREGWIQARVDNDLLRLDGRPVVAVIRLDGQLTRLDTTVIGPQIRALVNAWQRSGLNLRGVEIDHDCATSKLPVYAELLRALRQQLPNELALSITALPAWINSPALPEVLQAVDSSVLQVHSVDRPEAGLFNKHKALAWAQAYADLSLKPFYLALPAYGMALSTDGTVESEAPLPGGGRRLEMQADPMHVAKLLSELQDTPIPHLSGLIWFRLPLADDRRAWPLVTLQAVMQQQPLRSDLQVTVLQHGNSYDIRLVNRGNLSAALPQRIYANEACEFGDGSLTYRLQQTTYAVEFVRQQPGYLPAGQISILGWLHCSQMDQGGFSVTP
jgi:hypothetical protein